MNLKIISITEQNLKVRFNEFGLLKLNVLICKQVFENFLKLKRVYKRFFNCANIFFLHVYYLIQTGYAKVII